MISPAGNRSARAMFKHPGLLLSGTHFMDEETEAQGGPLTPTHLSQSPGSTSTWRGTSALQAVMGSFPAGQASAGGGGVSAGGVIWSWGGAGLVSWGNSLISAPFRS